MKKKVSKKKVEEVKEIDNLIADLEIDEEPVEKPKLSDEELKKDVTLLFNAENPYFSDELVEFSFKDLAYKTLSNFPHTVTLFSQSGYFIHKDLLKRRDEAEVKDAFPAEKLVSRRKNKFNFCDRAVQTLNNAFRETGLQTECLPQTKIGINATLIEITEAALFKENEDKMVTSSQRQKKNELSEVAFTAKVLERMVNQNNFLDVTLDFGFYDNPYDEFLENGMGSMLPLWKFCYKDTKGMTITSISWNYRYPDMFAVGYGTNQFLREMKGFICINTLKCPVHPERTFICDTGVQSIDFHHQWHHLLAAGFLDGIVAVFDLRRNEDIAFAVSAASGIQHTDMISQVKWLDDNIDNQHIFCSLGSDGKVISWCLVESELIGTEIISLNHEKCHVDGPEGTRMDAISGGVSMSFNNHNLNLFLVGTEDGLIHKCSGFYSNRYLSTYASHKNVVCSIEWNPYLPQIFLSCSEDWTVRIWHEQHSKHCFVFDMFSPIKAATWAPFSSTLFAAITKDRKIHIFDLAVNRQKPICSYTYSQRNSEKDLNLTSIAFNPKLPIILAGDDKGRILSFKLSPNLRSSIRGGNQECQQTIKSDILFLPEPEIDTPNPVDFPHPRLTKGRRSTVHDKDLKPNAKTSNQLNEIVSYPPTKSLAAKEKDLLWKFRFSLIRQKKALAKFLKCINWKMSDEAEHALDLLTRWQGMDVEDALELFSPTYTNPTVRRYAVTRLQLAPDEDLLMYLLQLVQALKYENFDEISCDLYREFSGSVSSELSTMVKNKSPDCGSISADCDPTLEQTRDPSSRLSLKVESDSAISKYDLATFLINRACANDTLANYLFWYVKVESEDQNSSAKYSEAATDMYNTVRRRLSHALSEGSSEYKHRWAMLMRQQLFVHKLLTLMKTVAKENENRQKKIERLQTLLSNSEINKFNFTEFEPFPLLLDPIVKVKGILPEKATLFKSAFMPCLLTFVTVEGAEYMTIFKHGDDLRQDQLSLQMITLMDKLLKKEGLDLKLTPYHVLATGTDHGFVQYVDSVAIAAVLATEGNIQKFFRKHAPAEDGPYGISPEVMDTYVKSCAGYCVITYLLGVGDRHLDNLLLTKAGKLFHIDFGYILGRDPKPLPPPMKLCKEMVEAMGGTNSEHYEEFRKHCYAAFLHLRRYAPLILNLFSLMADANIPDIALEPDKAVKKIQDKFRLDLTDVEATHYLQDIIDDSVTAVMAAFVEKIHKIAQYLRK